MIRMLTYEEFTEMTYGSELREHYNYEVQGFYEIWKNGVPPKNYKEQYEQYEEWHRKNYSKLGQALK